MKEVQAAKAVQAGKAVQAEKDVQAEKAVQASNPQSHPQSHGPVQTSNPHPQSHGPVQTSNPHPHGPGLLALMCALLPRLRWGVSRLHGAHPRAQHDPPQKCLVSFSLVLNLPSI